VLAEADREIQLTLVDRVGDDELLEILKEMFGDDAADIIELLDEERAEKVLRALSGEEGPDVDVLLGYDPDSAGGIMSTEVFALPHNTTVSEAIETLQSSHEELEMAFYLYVVNEHGHLVGVCSLRQLVVSDASATLNDVMASDVISVKTDTDQEFVARIVARYNFLAVPVVDASNRLVGMVTVDDVIDVIREEATEDMLRLVGAGADLDDQTSAIKSTRQRMPWLAASFVGGLGSMFIINRYEASIQQIAALASFIPVILGMGGNVGTQAATIVTRGLALGRINSSQFLSVISREIATGAMLGLVYGAVLAVFIAVFQGSPDVGQLWQPWQLACTVSLGIITCMVLAATVGGGYPLLFDRFGIDPAIAAGPFVTTTIDVIGILAYFLIAKFFLPL
jgi:magnesium transporter